MRVIRLAAVVAALLVTAAGCNADSSTVPTTAEATTGTVRFRVEAAPVGVASIHVTVTGADFAGPIETDLVLADGAWLGSLLDVPPGTGRTVTAKAYDANGKNTFNGSATDVRVVAGSLTDVPITLVAVDAVAPGANTPPHFTSVTYPTALLSNQTATFFATAGDPDAGASLTYVWTVLQGGGALSTTTVAGQAPDHAVSTVYTPQRGFTGFAVIQVSATDGQTTTTTTFPVAVGAGLTPKVTFSVPPDVTIVNVLRQSLMPNGSTSIAYQLTNPNQPWTPATMQAHTSWSDSCGGSFNAAPENLSIAKNTTTSRVVTYTAPASALLAPKSCKLTLTVQTADVTLTTAVNTWVDPPMVIFVSSAPVTGGTFGGQWQNADAFCQNLADNMTAVVPTGTYRALLSFDSINAIDRLRDTPLTRVDGSLVARNKAELYSLNLLNAVRTDEHNAFNGSSFVYTGTTGSGVKGDNCNNWTSSNVGAAATVGGSTTATNPGWTGATTQTCDTQLPIYCVQQPGAL